MQTDDIDLHLQRMQHGWSFASLWINGEATTFRLTHILADPFETIANSALNLSPDVERASFDWHDEPGCYRWTFERLPKQHNLFSVTVQTYREMDPTTFEEPTDSLMFMVDIGFWKQLVYAELVRTSLLLKFSPYRDERRPETFPIKLMHLLERQLSS